MWKVRVNFALSRRMPCSFSLHNITDNEGQGRKRDKEGTEREREREKDVKKEGGKR